MTTTAQKRFRRFVLGGLLFTLAVVGGVDLMQYLFDGQGAVTEFRLYPLLPAVMLPLMYLLGGFTMAFNPLTRRKLRKQGNRQH